ncbi:hypothetical protein, partial [Legionella worsleiensis]|uniref:hypothetical protein n=1 Tax=Legionella worsleiensis TaxID=45076 RepID=UPI001EE72A90
NSLEGEPGLRPFRPTPRLRIWMHQRVTSSLGAGSKSRNPGFYLIVFQYIHSLCINSRRFTKQNN